MKKILSLAIALFFTAGIISVSGQSKGEQVKTQEKNKIEEKQQDKNKFQHGRGFVDKNGDGFNDNAPDDDGDGIPNGLDPDFRKGMMHKKGMGFKDADGDGINDNAGMGKGKMMKHGFGMGHKGMGMKNGEQMGKGVKGKGHPSGK